MLKEHYGIEQTVLAGGYGYRQILELVQNGADAILEGQQHAVPPANGDRIHVLLRGSRVYVANTGAPLSEDGLDALLRSHSSPKRGNQIGRFGLGFKSLLKLEGRIDLFTRSGAIRFDPARCSEELRRQFKVTDTPSLRLAWPLDETERSSDSTCTTLEWAETIVRAEVRGKETHEHLRQEIRTFPAEFLLFFPVATVLTLDDGEEPARVLRLKPHRGQRILYDRAEKSRWRVSEREIRVTDARALADATHIHARECVPLGWAFPLEGRREESGRFWAFFPTHTASCVPGILNAPWKLNSDRNAIIGGEWNTALMAEAARLVLKTYVRETVIAEKFQAMVQLGRANGRMNDFYDIWLLSRTYEFKGDSLARAIAATFARRKTEIPSEPPDALTDAFAQDPDKIQQWNSFVEDVAFRPNSLADVIQDLRAFLMPHAAKARRLAVERAVGQQHPLILRPIIEPRSADATKRMPGSRCG